MKESVLRRKLGNKGFSLIELMVVVVIISVLSAIAIPNYTRFKKRARRAEAKIHLSGLYMANKAFKVEFNAYTYDLALLGYRCDGYVRYNAGFATVAAFPVGSLALREAGVPTATQNNLGADAAGGDGIRLPGLLPDCNIDLEIAGDTTNLAIGQFPASFAGVNGVTFTAAVSGELAENVVGPGRNQDSWTVDQNKQFLVVVNGLDN